MHIKDFKINFIQLVCWSASETKSNSKRRQLSALCKTLYRKIIERRKLVICTEKDPMPSNAIFLDNE